MFLMSSSLVELDVGLRDQSACRRSSEGVALLLERGDDVVERVGVGVDLEDVILGAASRRRRRRARPSSRCPRRSLRPRCR